MKKTLALLMLAAMLVSTGCGNNTMQGAKQDAQEAAAKVDQAKQEAAATVNEAAQEAAATVNQATQNLAGGSANVQGCLIALEGLRPGMSLDEARNMFGEARPIDEDGYIFNNGVVIDMNDFGRIEEIKVMQTGLRTPEGIEVGTAATVRPKSNTPCAAVLSPKSNVRSEIEV